MKYFSIISFLLLSLKVVYSTDTETLTDDFLDLIENDNKSVPNPNGQIVHLTTSDFEEVNIKYIIKIFIE